MIEAVIADDIQILRQGPRAILGQDKDIQVVGLVVNDRGAWQLCRKHRPDVVLTDMRMLEYNGSYGITRIKEDYPDTKALTFTTFDNRETVGAAVGSGADGHILEEMEDDKVVQSIKAVCAGMRVFRESVFEGIRRWMAPGKIRVDMTGDLTSGRRGIMWLVARGMDDREATRTLFLAEGAVCNDIPRLLEKLKLKGRTQLAVFTVKHSLDE